MAKDKYSLDQVFDEFENTVVRQVRTVIPGLITSYNEATKLAAIQPAPNGLIIDGSVQVLPIITSVPVLGWRMGSFMLHSQVRVGDPTLVLVSDRGLDGWMQSGTAYSPSDTRHHSITDAIAMPGMFATPSTPTVVVGADEMYLGQDAVTQTVFLRFKETPPGKVTLEAGEILLGKGALPPFFAARATDPVGPNALMTAWMVAVNAAFAALIPPVVLPPVPVSLGTITSGSAKTKVE